MLFNYVVGNNELASTKNAGKSLAIRLPCECACFPGYSSVSSNIRVVHTSVKCARTALYRTHGNTPLPDGYLSSLFFGDDSWFCGEGGEVE